MSTILNWLRAPWLISAIVAGIVYKINSDNYVSTKIIPLNKQRMNNIKMSFYLMIILTVVMYIFKYICGMDSGEEYKYSGGAPPF